MQAALDSETVLARLGRGDEAMAALERLRPKHLQMPDSGGLGLGWYASAVLLSGIGAGLSCTLRLAVQLGQCLCISGQGRVLELPAQLVQSLFSLGNPLLNGLQLLFF